MIHLRALIQWNMMNYYYEMLSDMLPKDTTRFETKPDHQAQFDWKIKH